MKILYQLTSPMERTVLGKEEVERRRAFLQARAAPGSEVLVWSNTSAPPSIESAYDAARSVPALLDLVHKAEAEGVDGVIIGCFSDPGIEAAREIVSLPVIGPGAAAMHLAAQLGTRLSVISPLAGHPGRALTRMRELGLDARFASVRGMGMAVLDLAQDREAALERIAEAGRLAVERDGADILVLGCMSMAFLDLTGEVQRRLGVPVVNPVVAALKAAETIVLMGLAHSKAAYPMPPRMEML
ncbi:MAG: aspartate/glutamate racemase family protein [Geminicoccaceae bacterium]